jgi:hypothetical protein
MESNPAPRAGSAVSRQERSREEAEVRPGPNGTFTTTGCIGLSAAGTLDTSGGTFSGPIGPDCPGSPSGAFLDIDVP